MIPDDLIDRAVQAGVETDRNVKEALTRLEPHQVLIQIRDAHMAMEMYLRDNWPTNTDWDDQALYQARTKLRRAMNA